MTPMAIASSKPLIKSSFPPIAPDGAKLLILGTLPGEESLRLQQYYGHPRNHFWPIIAALANAPVPETYEERVALLHANKWALWDVLEGAERIGSADAAIRNPVANAFAAFFEANPAIRAVAFNGQKARDLFMRFVVRTKMITPTALEMIELPSSSPLYTKPFEEKLARWRTALSEYLSPSAQDRRAK
jgi:double-stranded uracil-DNA glycosylase